MKKQDRITKKLKLKLKKAKKTIAKYGDAFTAKQAEVDLATQVLETYRNELDDAISIEKNNNQCYYMCVVHVAQLDRASAF